MERTLSLMDDQEDTSYLISDYMLSIGYSVPRVVEAIDTEAMRQETQITLVDPRGRACELISFASRFDEATTRKQVLGQGSLGDNFTKASM